MNKLFSCFLHIEVILHMFTCSIAAFSCRITVCLVQLVLIIGGTCSRADGQLWNHVLFSTRKCATQRRRSRTSKHFLGWLVEEGVETHKNLSVCTRPMAKGKTNSCLCAASAGDLGLPVVIGLIWINLTFGVTYAATLVKLLLCVFKGVTKNHW